MRRIQEEGSTDLIKSIDAFPRPLRNKLTELVDNGTIKPGDLESRVTTALRELPIELALEALDRYATSALDTIRSKTGFMMGIIRKRMELRNGPGVDRRFGGRGGFGGGGGYDQVRACEREGWRAMRVWDVMRSEAEWF